MIKLYSDFTRKTAIGPNQFRLRKLRSGGALPRPAAAAEPSGGGQRYHTFSRQVAHRAFIAPSGQDRAPQRAVNLQQTGRRMVLLRHQQLDILCLSETGLPPQISDQWSWPSWTSASCDGAETSSLERLQEQLRAARCHGRPVLLLGQER